MVPLLADCSPWRWQDYYYRPVERDWGPFNLSNITVFCRRMKAMLADPELSKYELWVYTSDDQKTRSNVAMLMTAFSVIALGIEADNAARCSAPTAPWQPVPLRMWGVPRPTLTPTCAAFKGHGRDLPRVRHFP